MSTYARDPYQGAARSSALRSSAGGQDAGDNRGERGERGERIAGHAARATAAIAPVVGGAALYGTHVQEELSSAAASARGELEAAIAAQRDALRVEHEAQLARIRAEGDQLLAQLQQVGEHVRQTGQIMVERLEGAAFDVRDELNRMSAQLRGEGDERLDVLEDHLRSAVERARVAVEEATLDAVARIRAVAESEAFAHRIAVPGGPVAPGSEPALYLSPDHADDDDVDLG